MKKKTLKQLALLGLTSGLMISTEGKLSAAERNNYYSRLSEYDQRGSTNLSDEANQPNWLKSREHKDHGGNNSCGKGGCGKGSCNHKNNGNSHGHDKDDHQSYRNTSRTFHPFG